MADFTDAQLHILRRLADGILGAAAPAAAPSPNAPSVDIDGKYGDPIVRRDPKKSWNGPSYEGAKYSQCPSEYLTALAGYLEWGANKDAAQPEPKRHRNGTPFYEYARKDAALARAWAERNRGQSFAPPVRTVDDPYGHEFEPADPLDAGELPF